MSSRTILIILLMAASQLGAAASRSIYQWIDDHFFKRITVTGHRQLGYHMQTVHGDRDAYNSSTSYGLGDRRFTDFGNMTLAGKKVFGVLDFNIALADNRFQDPQSQKISLNLSKGPVSLDLGDVRGSLLNTNRFASFSKALYGAAAEYKGGRFHIKAVHSESKGSARTVPIQGNNSAGPYYLGSSQILVDSEEVQVDSVKMKPVVDYVINYDVGSITFVNKIIPPTSTIVVSFEVLGFNSTKGTISGAGASYSFGKLGRLGLTMIQQKSGASRGLNSRIEEFQGYGSSSNWYTLQFEPLRSRPIVVRLNGIIQQEGVHYIFDDQVPSIFRFLFDVPPTSTITVTYTPKPTQTIDGDRRVFGFDYRLSLGRDERNYLHYSQAKGELISGVNPMTGTARGLEGSYHWGPLEFRGSLRDVPHTFVGIESRGMNRNEKALDLELTYDKGPLKYGISQGNSVISIRRFDDDGNPLFSNSRVTTARAFASYRPQKGDPWTIEHLRTASRASGYDNRLDTTSLSTSHTFEKIKTRFAVEHQDGFGPISDGINSKPGKLSLDTVRVGADYATGDLTLAAKTSISQVDAAGKSGKGSDIGLSAQYDPSARFNLRASYNVSNSGQLAALGSFRNGLGYGYGGNGFSGGLPGSGFTPGATDYRVLSLSGVYRVSSRINLDAQAYQSRSSGSVSTNSESTAVGLGLSWDVGKGHMFQMSLDHGNTKFINAENRSQTSSVNLFFIANPPGPWAYRLGANAVVSGGNSQYKQDSVLVDAYLAHKINNRQRLSLLFQGGLTRGYLPQEQAYAAFQYEYRLFENIGLVGSYKWRNVLNSDPLLTSGAFRSSGFDLELTFNFGG